jgi:hypothetical protein
LKKNRQHNGQKKKYKTSDTNYHIVILGSACEIKLKRVGEWVDVVEHEQGSKRTKTKLIKTSLCMLSYSGVPVTRSLVLYACFVDRYFSFCTFSFSNTQYQWTICAGKK